MATPTMPHGADAAAFESRTMRKVGLRLIPFLVLCYFIAYVDRVNVGFAALTMNHDLGLSAAAFGLGGGLFFVAYVLFEVPSNLAMERVGAGAARGRVAAFPPRAACAPAARRRPARRPALRALRSAAAPGPRRPRCPTHRGAGVAARQRPLPRGCGEDEPAPVGRVGGPEHERVLQGLGSYPRAAAARGGQQASTNTAGAGGQRQAVLHRECVARSAPPASPLPFSACLTSCATPGLADRVAAGAQWPSRTLRLARCRRCSTPPPPSRPGS